MQQWEKTTPEKVSNMQRAKSLDNSWFTIKNILVDDRLTKQQIQKTDTRSST